MLWLRHEWSSPASRNFYMRRGKGPSLIPTLQSLDFPHSLLFFLTLSLVFQPFPFCPQCKVTYCTHCNVVSRCHSCWSPICSDCRPNKNYGYCETCDETFCSGCKVVSQCGACKTTQCEDCVAMAHCDLCAETFCDSCNDMTTCALCKSSVCNDCPLLPAENVTPDCHHPLECSHCFESYCGACRAVTECSVCFRLTCADCDEMTRCDECNKVNVQHHFMSHFT